LALVGGRMWQKTRIAQVNAQKPGVEKTTALNKLADRIEEFSTKRLLPFEMIKLLRAKLPPSVAFTRFTTGTTAETMDGGLYQVVAEAQTNNAADVATYQSALEGDKAVFDRVVVDNHGLRNGLTTFKLTVTFKPEALKPLPDQ
jgi:hypothetical protein